MEHFSICSYILGTNVFLENNCIYSNLISNYISGFLDLMLVFIFQPQNNKHGFESEILLVPVLDNE